MKHIFKLFIISTILFFTTSAFGNQWKIDPDHSEVRFQVKHILTTVSGTFNEFKGAINFDPQMPSKGKFDFTVNVKSVNTNNGKRDNHLKSKDFFYVDKFPEMTFTSTKVSHKIDNQYELEGKMSIKDVTKNITIAFEFLNPAPHPFEKKQNVSGFITKFKIPRLDYHVGNGKFLKMGVVGEFVSVEIAVEALTKK